MSSQQSSERTIRKAMAEADLVDCMIALPGQLFYSTQIPTCLWFLARNKANDGLRERIRRDRNRDRDRDRGFASNRGLKPATFSIPISIRDACFGFRARHHGQGARISAQPQKPGSQTGRLRLFFKQHRALYYERLGAIREDGDWEAWLAFFFEGVEVTASGAVETTRRLLRLFDEDAALRNGSVKWTPKTRH